MWEGFIGNQIRRANLRLLVANGALLFGVMLMVGNSWTYLRTSLMRPTSIDPARVASVETGGERAHEIVAFDVPELFETGYQQVTKTDGRQTGVEAEYRAAWAGDRILLVKTRPGGSERHLTGELVPTPDDLLQGVSKDLGADKRALLLPMMLNTVEYRSERWYLLVCIVVLGAIALWNLFRWHMRTRDFASHPMVKMLGGESVVREHGMQLDMEMTGGGQKFGGATLTANWIVVPSRFGTKLMRLNDAVWAYQLVTKHSVNFIPAGSSYSAVVFGRNGALLAVTGPQKRVNEFLQAIAVRAPWVVSGYTDELKQAFTKDRANFVAAVDARRTQPGRGVSAA